MHCAPQVQQKELGKACRLMEWKGDHHALWRVLDGDGSGHTGIEELDSQATQQSSLGSS